MAERSAFGEADLSVIRRGFARQMVAGHGLNAPRIEQAFAAVRREDFLGDDPWSVVRSGAMHPLIQNDPVLLYQDVLIALDPTRGVNNGSPSLHVLMLHRLGVRPGDRVLHVGAGGGYYTAILAELAGPTGHVAAVEFDPPLAARARAALAPWSNVTVTSGDGADFPVSDVDRIYVNFGVARPAELWLDHLARDGTLLFPLVAPPADAPDALHGGGAVFAVTAMAGGFDASFVSRCGFVRAHGSLAGDLSLRRRLHDAFGDNAVKSVASLRRDATPPERCWFWTPEWSLSFDPPLAS